MASPLNGWYSINLGDAVLAQVKLGELEAWFSEVFAQSNRPRDMAVFMRHESEGRLHCEVMIYFSPASASLAREFGAEPCERPSPNGLGLLAGSEEAWAVLFS